MEKITLNIPAGMMIDAENSDLSKGIINLKRKEDSQKKWEDFGCVKGWYIDIISNICELSEVDGESSADDNKNTYPTESLAKAALALSQLLQWRNKVWKEDGGWMPDWRNTIYMKWVIQVDGGKVSGEIEYSLSRTLSFRTQKIRDQFLKDHRDLIEQAKELL